MTYQTIYSSEATIPMQSDDLEALLERARSRNAIQGISGALIYTDGTFLQILEGERVKVQALMASILKDIRHESVVILREGEIPAAMFSSWKMAYVSATPEEAARWAGIGVVTGKNGEVVRSVDENLQRTAQFARDILALLGQEKNGGGMTPDPSRAKENPWHLRTPPGSSEYTMHTDLKDGKPVLVCTVGKTILLYDHRCIADLHAMLDAAGTWVELGGADEQKPAREGTVEAWGRSEDNPIGGWYGLKKGLRGRFAVYVPPLMEELGLCELEHNPKGNRMRAKPP